MHHETDQVRIVIPHQPMGRIALGFSLIPLAIPLVAGPSLLTFFRDSRTPEPIGWAIIAFVTLFFGILPTATVVNGFLRSQRGGTIVHVSRRGIRVEERGAWKTQTVADLDARRHPRHRLQHARVRRGVDQERRRAQAARVRTPAARADALAPGTAGRDEPLDGSRAGA